MTAPFRIHKVLVWAAVLVLTAAVVSIVLGRPKEVTHPVLGTEWQCKHLAILTSCSRIAPARQSSRANLILFHRV